MLTVSVSRVFAGHIAGPTGRTGSTELFRTDAEESTSPTWVSGLPSQSQGDRIPPSTNTPPPYAHAPPCTHPPPAPSPDMQSWCKNTKFMYLSKNTKFMYLSKSTRKKATQVNVLNKNSLLITLARLQDVTIVSIGLTATYQ